MSCCSNQTNDNLCPMRMNDGRAFTDYRPRCMVNYDMVSQLSEKKIINSSYESRMYLQRNADEIMELEKRNAVSKVNCVPCEAKVNTMLPEKYMIHCDTVSCKRDEANIEGLGDGRRY
jgi:hypothetical protein